MSLDRVPAGNKLPDEFNVVIEIPMNADPASAITDLISAKSIRIRILIT